MVGDTTVFVQVTAIISARFLFRLSGARVSKNSRRVRDDYWETDAVQQGFTEEDFAENEGSKEPKLERQLQPPRMQKLS